MRRVLLVLLGLLGVGLLGYGLTGVVAVRPGERAVVRRFGRVLDRKPGPGLWIGLPWGMDRVDLVPVERVQTVTVGFAEDEAAGQAMPSGQLLTGDQNLIDVQAVIFYKVQADRLEDYVAHQDRVPALIARAAESVLGEWVAGRTIDDVLLNGKNELRPVLKEGVRERLEPYGLGVEVLDAQAALLAPPGDVKAAFDNVARAQTRIATLINQAEQEAEARLRAARSDAFRVEQTALAYATGQKLLAERDAERFRVRLARYREGLKRNPFYLRQIWEEERGKVFGKLKDNGQLGLLDHHLGPDGLDLSVAPPLPKK
jgi:membrane protease subunit HflK